MQIHCNLPDGGGNQGALCALDVWFLPWEVSDQDILVVPKEFPIHQGGGGYWHVQRVRLVVPALPCEGNLEPVDDVTTTYLGSGVNDGSSESLTCFSGQYIPL